MDLAFTYDAQPGRVIFGAGRRAELGAEVERLGAAKVLFVSTPRGRALAEELATAVGVRAIGVLDDAVVHVPLEVAEAGRIRARELGADCCVAVGGGSTTGLAKAIALTEGVPVIAVPTTYSGSELTPIWGLTEAGVKTTGRDARVLPRTVIYDPELLLDLPPQIVGPSGMNAAAHCVEGLYSEGANPITSLMAEEGLRALATALPRAVARPDDIDAQAQALYGAYLAGAVIAAAGTALHHKLCHALGGAFDLPHAETHTVILPHAAAYNAPAVPDAMARVARAIGADAAARGLYDLAHGLGAPISLAAIGMAETDLDRAAELACANPYPNPRPITRPAIRALLEDAFYGRPPRAN
jgi:maleylacetate reductase